MPFDDATAYSSTGFFPPTNETVSQEGNMFFSDTTAYSSTSSSLHDTANQRNRITRGQHVLRRCHRVQLHELFSPPTNETLSHEGNMSFDDATTYSSTSSSLRQPTNLITRGQHVHQRCHRVKLHQPFSSGAQVLRLLPVDTALSRSRPL